MEEYAYFAFISYKREDERMARWVQRRLEHYKLPLSVRRNRPELPAAVRPVCRDTTDLEPGRLAERISEKLARSRYLIVLCSPRAARSEWVDKEVREFIDSGRADRIIPFIIGGTPNSGDPETECFPSSLRELSGDRELLGVHIAEMGREAAAVKVIARLLGLGFDTLWQRHEREKRRRLRTVVAASMALTVAAVCLVFFFRAQSSRLLINQSRAVARAAHELIAAGDLYLAQRLCLEVLPADLRHPDRPYVPEAEAALRAAADSMERPFGSVAVLENSSAVLSTISFSPDGNCIAFSQGPDLFLCDVRSGLLTQLGAGSLIRDIAFSSDGNHIAVATNSGVCMWNTRGKSLKKNLVLQDDVSGITTSVVFNPQGDYLASMSESTVAVWNIGKGDKSKQVRDFPKRCRALAFGPDGCVATCSEEAVYVWNVMTGTVKTLAGHEGDVNSVAFSPDGRYLASASEDRRVRIWNVSTGDAEILAGHERGVNSVAFSPNGRFLASASEDRRVRIWNVSTGDVKVLTGHEESVKSVAFSPDGRYLAACSNFFKNIRIWDVSTGDARVLAGHGRFVSTIAFSPDGEYFASLSDEAIRIWNVPDRSEPGRYYGHFLGFSPDGSRFLAGGSVYDTRTRERFEYYWRYGFGNERYAEISPDGERVVASVNDTVIAVYNVAANEEICRMQGHSARVNSARFSPDGNSVVSASDDGTIRIWDARNGEELHRTGCWARYNVILSYDEFESLGGKRELSRALDAAFSPDMRRIVAVFNGEIRLLNAKTGRGLPPRQFESPDDYILKARFSKDGRRVVATSYQSEGLYNWDAKTGRRISPDSRWNADEKYSVVRDYDENTSSILFDGTVVSVLKGRCSARPFNPEEPFVECNGYLLDFPSLQELIDRTRERFGERELTAAERQRYYLE